MIFNSGHPRAGHRLQLLYLVLVLPTVIGCGDSRPYDAVIVHGKILYQGTPVENGEIRFIPAPGTPGPVTGAPINNGEYEVKAKGGVPVGKHGVRIQAFGSRSDDATVANEAAADFVGDVEQYLPEEYNERSQLTAQVNAGATRQQLDFELGRD